MKVFVYYKKKTNPIRVKVIGHAKDSMLCIAVSTLMQTVGLYLETHSNVPNIMSRSHDEHSTDKDVSMQLHYEGTNPAIIMMMQFLEFSLLALIEQNEEDVEVQQIDV